MGDEVESMRSSHPLHKLVLCCTSIEQDVRNKIERQCIEMGGRHILDLTSEVTHLICGELNTPKYIYVAKYRPDVKVVKLSWVEEIYKQWMQGDDVEPRDFEVEHRFPVFYGLLISLTGITDVEERRRVEEVVQREGGIYCPDLLKKVSRLIAAAPTGKKYEFAKMHGIPIVAREWLWDSLERGMALEEKFYDPILPPDKLGVGAKPSKPVVPTEVQEFRGKRKIRQATQDKLSAQSQSLWSDIVGQAANIKPKKRDEWEEDIVMEQTTHRASYGSDSGSNPFTEPAPAKKDGMFADAGFFAWEFTGKQATILKVVIPSHGGTIVSSMNALEKAHFAWKLLIVPREKRASECPELPDGIIMVTEWWLEACLHYKRFVKPTGDFTTMPIEQFEVEGFKGLDISITNFSGIDLLFFSRLIGLLGGNFHDFLSNTRSLLVTNDSRESESEKIRFAHMQNIPVVTGEWIIECLQQHQKLPFDGYLIKPPVRKELLGDRFKRKRDSEASTASKRLHSEEYEQRDEQMSSEDREHEPDARASAVGQDESGANRAKPNGSIDVDHQGESASRPIELFSISAGQEQPADEGSGSVSLLPFQSPQADEASISKDSTHTASHILTESANPPNSSHDRPKLRKASSSSLTGLSGISEILGKFGKDQLTSANSGASKKPRGRLQGRATTGASRVFSRTPSLGGNTPASSQRVEIAAVRKQERIVEEEIEPIPSQALGYNYEETSMEKKKVRQKLDKYAHTIETPKSLRVKKTQPAVDLVPHTRRSTRKSIGRKF